MTELSFLNVEGIGVMVSVDDMVEALKDAMLRSEPGGEAFMVYEEVADMLGVLADDYMNEDECECECDEGGSFGRPRVRRTGSRGRQDACGRLLGPGGHLVGGGGFRRNGQAVERSQGEVRRRVLGSH